MKGKHLLILLASVIWLPLTAATTYTVVLDPGHGGKDPGAVGRRAQEKDLNLSLALEVGKLISEQYPDVKVVYTRSTDVFIPLQTRADIANRNNADLFISIHTNSAESKTACGVETFILGTDKMEKNLDVAMRENAVMKLESDYKTTYQGFDPNSIDSYIMFELMQNSYMDQSLRFAELVQKGFVGQLNRDDRGVRQAAFWVLLKTACPSILFEMGFISNPEEERFLSQPSSIHKMAQTLVTAFGTYTHKQAVKKEVTQKPQELKATKEVNTAKEAKDAKVTKKTYYAVQLCASKTPLAPTDERLKGRTCEYIQVGEWYKYYTAANTDRVKTEAAKTKLKKDFPDCWIIKIEK